MVANLPDIFSTPSNHVDIYDVFPAIETGLSWIFWITIGVVLGMLFYTGVKSLIQRFVSWISNN